MQRARKRGCTQCKQCGENNGNRAINCKSCGRVLPGKENKRHKQNTTRNISALNSKANINVFSCRVRKEGPDYRTFVTRDTTEGKWTCFNTKCLPSRIVRSRSKLSQSVDCEHIPLVKLEHGESVETDCQTQAELNQAKLDELPIPLRYKTEIRSLLKQSPYIIQRVSSESFAVRDNHESQEHPLGLLHVQLQRAKQIRQEQHQSVQKPFYCPCSAFHQYHSQIAGPSSISKPSRRCVHFYICLWAVASDESIHHEFPFAFSDASSSMTKQSEETGHQKGITILTMIHAILLKLIVYYSDKCVANLQFIV